MADEDIVGRVCRSVSVFDGCNFIEDCCVLVAQGGIDAETIVRQIVRFHLAD